MKTKPFDKMTAAQKRVAIAEDAIKQIRLRRYKIKRNRYLSWGDGFDDLSLFSQKSLTEPKATCRCCQIGACIASSIRLFNGKTTKELGSNFRVAMEILSSRFEPAQIALIERAFESEGGFLMGKLVKVASEELRKAGEFGSEIKTERAKALAIFRNIIANKGTFKP